MIIKFNKIVRFFSMSKIFVCNIDDGLEYLNYFSKFAIVIVLEYFGKKLSKQTHIIGSSRRYKIYNVYNYTHRCKFYTLTFYRKKWQHLDCGLTTKKAIKLE